MGIIDYFACGEGTGGNPVTGQGLYNSTGLDIDNDGNAELYRRSLWRLALHHT